MGHLFDAVREQIERVCERPAMRIVHWSVQTDHVHLVVEAEDRVALSRGVQGLAVRLARAINRIMKRRGKVFADRFHQRVLETPRQTRNGIAYTLCNGRKHGHSRGSGWMDPCSSAAAFDGWSRAASCSRAPPRVAPARTWLLRTGWRRGGCPIDVDHLPGKHDLW